MRRLAAVGVLALMACGGSGSEGPRGAAEGGGGRLAAGGVSPATTTLSNPLRGNAKAIRTGELLFGAMNCDGCHGVGAAGQVAPSLIDGRWRYGGDETTIFRSIFEGRPRGMPAYGGILSDTTIWQLVTYLQSQPVTPDAPVVSWPNAP